MLALASLGAGCGGDDTPAPVRVGGAEPDTWVCGDAPAEPQRDKIYVSEAGSYGSACGKTTSATCRSVAAGVSACGQAAGNCSVLVHHGLYSEGPIPLSAGVHLIGGCRSPDEPDRHLRTVIQTVTDEFSAGAAAVAAGNLRADTLVRDVVILAAEKTAAGAASIGLAAEFSPGLRLVGTLIVAGQGGDGVAGGPVAAGVGQQGGRAEGEFGHAGGNACTGSGASIGQGGQGGEGLRPFATVAAGRLFCQYPNADASVGRAGQPSGAIPGGGNGGSHAFAGAYCQGAPDSPNADFEGRNGQEGRPGSCGTTGGSRNPDRIGSFGDLLWSASVGGAGSAGEVGSGGGGGNSGGYCVGFDGAQPSYIGGVGAAGGGGGGCGGPGGAGGQLGGASIALVVVGDAIQRDPRLNVLVPGIGGPGGQGGSGNAGGPGGDGGAGSGAGSRRVGAYACPGPSGRGGAGGQGGAGAGGAGGNGGPSIGIALTAGAPVPASTQGIYPPIAGSPGGFPGPGGRNAAGQCQGVDGADGGLPGLGLVTVSY